MPNSRNIVACVVDHGLFLPIAQKIAEQYEKVYYWCPWDDCAPKVQRGIIGDGFDGIERVDSVWDVKSKCDLFVFPDVGFGGMQRELISQGYPVWGHHGADELETDRGLFLGTLNHVGMDVPEFKVIHGVTALMDHLRDKEDKYIKVSKWRGNWETLHWRDWEQDESTLDYYAYTLGPTKELFTFYVFDAIEADVEDGIDTYCIKGKYPSLVMHGMECKDKSYLCAVEPYADISEKVRIANERFAPVLESYGYRGFFSTEVRVAGDKSFFIDPTCRAASPPSQVMTELFSNLGEIIWHGANGECIDPEPAAKFGAQALISVSRDCEEWTALRIPEEIRKWVKCGFSCEINGQLWAPPHDLKNMIGWLCAIGDSPSEAIENLKEHKEQLPDGLDCDVESIAHLIKEAEAAKEEGIEFPGKMPSVEEVVS